MDFVQSYASWIGSIISWLLDPETNVPAFRIVQTIAAVVTAAISAIGFYKAWLYAERRLGQRLNEFLEHEEERLVRAREAMRMLRSERSAVGAHQPKLFSNGELEFALRQIGKKRPAAAKQALNEALIRTQEREEFARRKGALHEKQKAMVHLLLGSIADSEGDHQAALVHFQSALEIDSRDVEALEYVGVQYLKLGNAAQALQDFRRLEAIARARGDKLLLAQALRNCGIALEAPPEPSYFNANIAYRDAILAFPKDGRVYELAHIHELRASANIKLPRLKQAHRSLMSALTAYSALEHQGNRDAVPAREGVKRVLEALDELHQLQSRLPDSNGVDDSSDDDNGGIPTTHEGTRPLGQQQSTQQSPDGERPN